MKPNKRTPVSRVVLAILAYDGLTQDDLATMLHLNQATVSRKLAGHQAWTEADIAALTAALGDGRDRLVATAQQTLRPLLTAPYATPAAATPQPESQLA